MRRRLDAELVRRRLARSRQHAAELIATGAVKVQGAPVRKAASQVDDSQAITVELPYRGQASYASRGAHKLAGALTRLERSGHPVRIDGLTCLDAGASTGGFTDVLLRNGAALVHAVDVGYGQLAWRLRGDPRVRVMDRTNVRTLGQGSLEPAPELVTADLSFISLTTVMPALAAVAAPGARFLPMVKPQFEVGRDKLPKGGVVNDKQDRAEAVLKVAAAARAAGLGLLAVTPSPLPGPAGNVEFFLLLEAGRDGLGAADARRAALAAAGLEPEEGDC
jgi:23S rRNA (cytidine1920-2'-O)/16S rRNA (cytidine1409-2'-O)-methyltransferase